LKLYKLLNKDKRVVWSENSPYKLYNTCLDITCYFFFIQSIWLVRWR